MLNIKLSDIIKVNDRFQNSINLQLDLNKRDKVASYIPTKSSVDILKRYLLNVDLDTNEKSTLLIGPYGKGKSHLLLVLMAILSMRYKPEDCEAISDLISKIELVDIETAEYITNIRNKKQSFLPVIISNTHMDLNQAFLVALNDALSREKLESLRPNTYYTEAIKVITCWEDGYPNTYKQFLDILKINKIKVYNFVKKLEQCDKEYLELFSEIYPNLTSGSKFNPMLNTETLTLYKQINDVICENGYSGLFIIFDEFSKYIEGHERDTISRDFKVIQDMCELANDSKGNQIHTLFVVHKSLKEYNNILSKEVINAFRGIEGRLKEILFLTSSQNNYELIQNAIIKKNNYEYVINDEIHDHLLEVKNMPAFKALFNEEDFKNIVVKGCFPLSPISSYLLLNICEIVAQNERTLFTFISKDEPLSMARFINEHKRGEDCIVNADYIYDYFKGCFRGEVSNQYIHTEWLKAEYALKQVKDNKEQKILKTLAIINIVNRFDELPPVDYYLKLATGLFNNDATKAIENLEKHNIIDKRSSTGQYYFKNNIGIDLERKIKKRLAQLPINLNYVDLLQKLSDYSYLQPKVHNQKYSIKRYFEYKFYSYDNFLNLNESRVMFEETYSDGKILLLFTTKENELQECVQKIEKLNDDRIIAVLPNKKFKNTNKLKEYYVLQKLKEDAENTNENIAVIEEIKLYEEEVIYEINKELKSMYGADSKNRSVIHCSYTDNRIINITGIKELNRIVSDICDRYYCRTPKINNEMINKNVISSQIKAARSSLINRLIMRQEMNDLYKSTAPEGSIFRATLVYTGVGNSDIDKELGVFNVINEIKLFIKACDGKKLCFKYIYDKLTCEPIGMRIGTIPIYLTFALCGLQDTPIIYLNDREVPFDANIINNINETPIDYYLYVEKGTKEKIDYLESLRQLFDKYIKNNDEGNAITRIVIAMQRWMQSLSTISSNFANTEIAYLEDTEFAALRKLRVILKKIECNPRELLFQKIPELFKQESLYDCVKHIGLIKNVSDEYLFRLKNQIVVETKNIFDKKSDEDLNIILTSWYIQQSETSKSTLASTKITMLMSFVAKLDTFNENDIVNKLSKIVLDIHIENWTDETMAEYKDKLNNLKKEIEYTIDNQNQDDSKKKLVFNDDKGNVIERFYEEDCEDSTCYFLKNELSNVLDEFGDTLELNQKVSILVHLISDLVK